MYSVVVKIFEYIINEYNNIILQAHKNYLTINYRFIDLFFQPELDHNI